jgi:hypothetical protein
VEEGARAKRGMNVVNVVCHAEAAQRHLMGKKKIAEREESMVGLNTSRSKQGHHTNPNSPKLHIYILESYNIFSFSLISLSCFFENSTKVNTISKAHNPLKIRRPKS